MTITEQLLPQLPQPLSENPEATLAVSMGLSPAQVLYAHAAGVERLANYALAITNGVDHREYMDLKDSPLLPTYVHARRLGIAHDEILYVLDLPDSFYHPMSTQVYQNQKLETYCDYRALGLTHAQTLAFLPYHRDSHSLHKCRQALLTHASPARALAYIKTA